MIKWRYIKNNSDITSSTLLYIEKDLSFDLTPHSNKIFSSVGVNTINIDINQSGKVLSVWGLCPKSRWISRILNPPNAIPYDIVALSDNPFLQNVSVALNVDGYAPVLFDKNNGWVTIVVENREIDYVSCALTQQIIFDIGAAHGELLSIWLHPVFSS